LELGLRRLRGIVANAAKTETEALAVNAKVRSVAHATLEEINGPTSATIYALESQQDFTCRFL
jgi:hypothetical protein